MARFLIALLSVALMAFFFQVEAVPLHSRQIGDVQCNAARLKTVASLAATKKAVSNIDTSNSTATGTAVTDAQTGLDSASAGIKTIAAALLTGKTAPADARDQVKNGLLSAQTALNGITTGDATTAEAQSKLNDTISAGSDVVANCN
ncbi:uncharacterized protein EV420DRAFT_556962 [Desarmillaria tabescens]|uniref:Uncharacterized protein n=1 Tax=Armillaria tabescens TaxID=1929756 RepID=A0AA39N332_ARMTA|nr:uncharacterized protein EV420DRAFT_556962 [Desarmillaria tabescens]KAK0455703.1 hypothetical protein EV420DRAFT_556962 [Desarmillaria tabescens]